MHMSKLRLQSTSPLLRVGVLTAAQDGLSAQAVRVLAGLAAPPFAVRVFDAPQIAPEPLAPGVAAVLAAERRLVPPPDRSPLPTLAPVSVEPVAALDAAVLDVIIDLGGGPVDMALAQSALHGLWRIETSPLCATLSGATCTEAVLVRHGGLTGPRIVARAVYDCKPLATHNAAYVWEKSAQMILREIKRCAHLDAVRDLGPAMAAQQPGRPSALGYVARTAGKSLDRLRKALARRLGLFSQGFVLRIGRGSALDFDPATARAVPMPAVSLWADPFLIAHDGALYCFFEDVDPVASKGHISVGRLTEAGIVDVKVALNLPHHMSYPFVFHHAGELLMMPEVHSAGRLEIWRCTDFPSGWEVHATALEGTPVCDSVLLQRGEDWWLFTHISRDRFGDFCSDLHVFKVNGPDLTGLVPHRLNPVVTDAATARGGGRIHQADGRLLRFSQDNSCGSYGGALNVMEITQLDLDHYEERRLRHITPDFAPGLIGCHHFDAAEGWFVIDVRKA